MDRKNELGAVIKALRKENEVTQSELSEAIGKSIGTVGQYERGDIYPNYETLYKIIEFFDADANIFFSREKKGYSIESLLMFNLLSQMKECDKNTIIKFHQNLSSLLNLIGNDIPNSQEEGEKT